MTARKLVLHVGHGKTGSSMIQSVLALSRDGLAEDGVLFPEFPALEVARLGRISSGNLDTLRPKLASRWKRAISEDPGARTVLFSNEGLFQHTRIEADLQRIRSSGVAVEVLLLIRDPLDHRASGYGQQVKRHGVSVTFAEALKNYAKPERVFDYLTTLRSAGIEVKVANYSRHAGNLVETFASMLGVNPDKLVRPPVKVVNRSLSGSELHLMRRLNERYDTAIAMQIADALCNELPDIPAGRPYLSPEDHAAFNARMAPMIEKVNAIIPEDEHYRLSSYETYASKGMAAPGEPLSFTPEQIDVIVGHLPGDRRREKGKGGTSMSALRRMFGR